MYNDIINKITSDTDILLDETHIDDILIHNASDYPAQIISTICSCAEEYAASIVNQLRELECDLRIDRSRFCGGGSIMLKPYLIKTGRVPRAEFSTELNENAAGFEWGITNQSK